MPPVVAVVVAAEHAGAGDADHRARPPATGQDAVHIDGIVVQVLAVAEVFPMLAAIDRADRAADLDRAVENVGLAGAGVHLQDALRRVGARSRGDLREAHADRQPRPALAAIIASVDLAILTADEDHVGVVRMKQDRPHRLAVVGHLDLVPMLAAIGAAIEAQLRPGIHDLRVKRMDRQRAHRRRLGQAALDLLPFITAVGQAEQPRMHHPAAAGFARKTEVEIGLVIVAVAGHLSALPIRAASSAACGGAWQLSSGSARLPPGVLPRGSTWIPPSDRTSVPRWGARTG